LFKYPATPRKGFGGNIGRVYFQDDILDEIKLMAIAADKAKREPSVVVLLQKYLECRPDDAFMWFLFGDSLRVVGQPEQAESALRRALELAPERRSHICKALAALFNECGRFAEAEKLYAELCLDPDFTNFGWLWMMRGTNLAAAGELPAAEACHRKALTFDDEHLDRDEAYLNLGYVLRAQGCHAEAQGAFLNALVITPDHPEAIRAIDSLKGIEDSLTKVALLR
jgi:tetratricopeptide (TPR) repeat protein